MARFRQHSHRDQAFLLPPSMREWLPSDHLAWFLSDAIDSLNVDALLEKYRVCGKGELAYDPRLLLKVLTYGYATGVVSSRKIAMAIHENVAFRVLSYAAPRAIAPSVAFARATSISSRICSCGCCSLPAKPRW